MPRTARLNVRGGIFHLISRFTRDERCLARAGARDAYLRLIGAAASRTDAKILAYCLMSTHVHLVVQQGDDPLSRLTKSVHTGFAGWIHHSAGRKTAGGPVFAGRARTILVDADEYLLQLVRYVHNNPVRAALVRHARESNWSSHRAYIDRAPAPAWLETEPVLSRFGRSAAEAFDRFVEEGREERRRPELSGAAGAAEAAEVRRKLGDGHRISDGVLGNEKFTARVREARGRIGARLSTRDTPDRASKRSERPQVREVIDMVLWGLGVDAIELKKQPRSQRSAMVKRLATWVWIHDFGGQQIDLARALSIHTSVVSRYYGQAVEAAADFEEMGHAIVSGLRRTRRPAGKPGSTSLAVRYHVDVEED